MAKQKDQLFESVEFILKIHMSLLYIPFGNKYCFKDLELRPEEMWGKQGYLSCCGENLLVGRGVEDDNKKKNPIWILD